MDVLIHVLTFVPLYAVKKMIDGDIDSAYRQYISSGHYIQDMTGELDTSLLPDLDSALPRFNPEKGYPKSYYLVLTLYDEGFIDTLPVPIHAMVMDIYRQYRSRTFTDYVLRDRYLIPRLGLYSYLDRKLQSDRDIIADCILHCTLLPMSNSTMATLNDHETMLDAVRKNAKAITLSSLQYDREFVLPAVRENIHVFKYVSKFHYDLTVREEALQKDKNVLDFLYEEKSSNIIDMMLAFEDSTRRAPNIYRSDKTLMLKVLDKHPRAVKHIHPDLQNDDDIIITVIKRLLNPIIENGFWD